MKAKPLLWLATLSLALPLYGQTSNDNPRLKKALERFPAADANKDGVLTMKEAQAFRKTQQAPKAKTPGAKPAQVPEGGERHIYKTVGDVELPLYVFNPEGHSAKATTPAIVFFFGGGWRAGSPTQFEPHCKALADRGMVAITVEYRVSSRHDVKVEDCIADAKSAMRWVRGHASTLGIDPDRIASGGGSAGGHLAACVMVVDDFDAESDNLEIRAKPNAMVLFNPAMGPFDEVVQQGDRTRGPVKKITPLTYASTEQPPCVMFFGTADGLLEGAETYRQRSVEAGNDCKIVTYEDQGHGFFNHGRNDNRFYDLTLAETDKFLVDLGWLSRQ